MSQIPKIGYRNLLTEGVLNATSQTAGFPKENAVDWFTDDFWKPTAGGTQRLWVDLGGVMTADFIGIAAHDLATQGASVRVQNSTDGVSWFNVSDEITPVSNAPLCRFFAAESSRYWALRVTSPVGVRPSLGVVSLGPSLTLPMGWYGGYAPASLNVRTTKLVSKSDSGQFIGQSIIRRAAEDRIELKHVNRDWVREHWQPFAKHARSTPFFLAWYPDLYPDEVIYVTDADDAEASNEQVTRMTVSMTVRGIAE